MTRIKARFVAIIIGVLVLALVGAFLNILSMDAEYDVMDFSDGWTVEFKGNVDTPSDISEYIFPEMAGRGDVITLSREIPDDIDSEMSVRMLIYLSGVEASVDGTPRYSYGGELLRDGHFVGSGYHYIPIFPPDAGKTLTVTVIPAENNAFSSISGIAMIPSEMTAVVFAKNNMFSIFVSIFLVILGVALLVLSVAAFYAHIRKSRLFYIGCFSILMGFWSMGSDKILGLFYSRYEVVTAIEYFSLYMALVPFLALVINMRSEAVKWKRTVLYACVFVLLIFDAVSLALHISDIAHFPALLSVFHILAAVCVLALIIAAIQPLRLMQRADRLLNMGILCLVASGAVDIVRFNLHKYMLSTNRNLDASVLPFGVLVFIVLLIMSYLVFLFDEIIAQTEKRMLENLAYEDPLTGLYNRTRCEEMFAELKESGEGYALINIDLNGLKRTNDTLGHSKGDELIATFGGILKEAFENVGASFRMGGDEFMVIVPEVHIPDIDGAIETMETRSKEVSRLREFDVAAAWGMEKAGRGSGLEPEDIYKLADEKMYAMKTEMKAATAESR